MQLDASFYTVWREFQGKAEQDQLPICPIGKAFGDKIQATLFDPLGNEPTREQIARAKFWLQEEWQAWKNAVPIWHLQTCSTKSRCLAEIYDEYYDRLRLMELRLAPMTRLLLAPDGVTPPVPSSPPPPTIHLYGFPLGSFDPQGG